MKYNNYICPSFEKPGAGLPSWVESRFWLWSLAPWSWSCLIMGGGRWPKTTHSSHVVYCGCGDTSCLLLEFGTIMVISLALALGVGVSSFEIGWSDDVLNLNLIESLVDSTRKNSNEADIFHLLLFLRHPVRIKRTQNFSIVVAPLHRYGTAYIPMGGGRVFCSHIIGNVLP